MIDIIARITVTILHVVSHFDDIIGSRKGIWTIISHICLYGNI